MVAQGCHASVAAILIIQDGLENYRRQWDEWLFYWLDSSFKKICVGADSEAELVRIHDEARAARLPVKLITDNGQTEFHGVLTRTCLAIGPAPCEEIDKITGGLKLL